MIPCDSQVKILDNYHHADVLNATQILQFLAKFMHSLPTIAALCISNANEYALQRAAICI